MINRTNLQGMKLLDDINHWPTSGMGWDGMFHVSSRPKKWLDMGKFCWVLVVWGVGHGSIWLIGTPKSAWLMNLDRDWWLTEHGVPKKMEQRWPWKCKEITVLSFGTSIQHLKQGSWWWFGIQGHVPFTLNWLSCRHPLGDNGWWFQEKSKQRTLRHGRLISPLPTGSWDTRIIYWCSQGVILDLHIFHRGLNT